MKITNLTNPGKEPVNNDLVRYDYEDGSFIEKHFFVYEPSPERVLENKINEERQWRDVELASTDFIVPLVDHPKHSAYMTYRQELRDYPAQPDFPNGTRPVKP
jgi:hypothetical protein